MLQSFIYRLLARRHFWRYATFSEVAELYTSRTMRLFALRLIAVFTSVYLYQEGYSLVFISLFFVCFFMYKVICSWPSAILMAWIGPKRGTFVSNIMAAVSMMFLPLVPEHGIWAIAGWGITQASSTCLYDLCYLVGFSKVKSVEHAGKEIAFMNMFEKVATGISPVVGGLLALWAGPESVMVVSAAFFLLAALPLFSTDESVRTRQKIKFAGFPWRTTWRSFVAEIAVGYDGYVTGTVWTLFIAVAIFAGDGDELYAKLGALTSVTIIAALVSSYAFGKLIDRRKGGELLRMSAILNSFTHIMRAFISTPTGIVFANITNEAATTGYSMAFTRGLFDTADFSGKRIAYLFIIEVVANLGNAIAALVLAVILMVFPVVEGMQAYFIASGLVVLIIATPRFAIYRR